MRAPLDAAAGAADATAGLWRRLDRPFEVTRVADVMMGLAPAVVEALGAVRLCTSPEAEALLAAMPALSRSLTTSVRAQSVRSRGEVRGPVLWSETMAARASSFGDEDLFVCSAPQRDYDTPANRALVQALRTLYRAGAALDNAPESWRDVHRMVQARTVSRSAHDWLEHSSLARVSNERVDRRELTRVRGGKSASRYAPALAMLEVAAEPLGPDDLVLLCDRRTRLQHWVLLAVIRELEQRGLTLPPLRVEGAALMSGPLTYIHPRHRMGEEQVHGILVGHVLLDVVDDAPAEHTALDRSADGPLAEPDAELRARAGDRPAVGIRTYRDVPVAVDLAVRSARVALGGV